MTDIKLQNIQKHGGGYHVPNLFVSLDYSKNLHLDSVSPATDKIMEGIILSDQQFTDHRDNFERICMKMPCLMNGRVWCPSRRALLWMHELFGDIEWPGGCRISKPNNFASPFRTQKTKNLPAKHIKPKMFVKLPKPSSHYYSRSRSSGVSLEGPLSNLETIMVPTHKLKRLPTTKDVKTHTL